MINSIKTNMQQLRIHKLISARTCEFLHILRQLQSHFFGEMLTKCFYTTKKGINIFLTN